MENDKEIYATWHGQPLTKLEYLLIKDFIISDIIVEEDLLKTNMADAIDVITKIKKL
jgi:hypothetical protein